MAIKVTIVIPIRILRIIRLIITMILIIIFYEEYL